LTSNSLPDDIVIEQGSEALASAAKPNNHAVVTIRENMFYHIISKIFHLDADISGHIRDSFNSSSTITVLQSIHNATSIIFQPIHLAVALWRRAARIARVAKHHVAADSTLPCKALGARRSPGLL
jgi:hypothetical protein